MKKYIMVLVAIATITTAGCSTNQTTANPNVYWSPDSSTKTSPDQSKAVQVGLSDMLVAGSFLDNNAQKHAAADVKVYGTLVQSLWMDISAAVKSQFPEDHRKIELAMAPVVKGAQDPKDTQSLVNATQDLMKSLQDLQQKLK